MTDTLDFSAISNPWQAMVFIVCMGFFVLAYLAMNRTRKGAEKKNDETQQVVEQAAKVPELWDTVDLLTQQARRMAAELERQGQKIEAMEPIVNKRYPAAVEHIRVLHKARPELNETHPIPDVLREDLEVR